MKQFKFFYTIPLLPNLIKKLQRQGINNNHYFRLIEQSKGWFKNWKASLWFIFFIFLFCWFLSDYSIFIIIKIFENAWHFFYCHLLPWNIIFLSIGIVTFSSPITALFCLIGAFIHVVILLISLKVEFLALLLLIVYVGAVAILFLFAVMMFNLTAFFLKKNTTGPTKEEQYERYISILFFYYVYGLIQRQIGTTLCLQEQLYIRNMTYYERKEFASEKIFSEITKHFDPLKINDFSSNANIFFNYKKMYINDIYIFSNLFYTAYGILFLFSGLILLISMIGALTLTNLTKKYI